jgi:hypothetical protein
MTVGTPVRVIKTGQTGHVVGPSKDGKLYVNIGNKGWFKFDIEELLEVGTYE